MIAVDSSAIIAIATDESTAEPLSAIIQSSQSIIISAGTLTEVLIVAARRKLLVEVNRLLRASVTEIIDLTPERAQLAAEAYTLWGKGFHHASLNFGDCFAYATAREFDCPLLYVGNDFSQTDVRSAIPSPAG